MAIRDQIQEMCLALIQVSVRCRRHGLRDRFERMAFELLEHGSVGDFEKVAEKLDVLDGFVNFGKAIYEIEPINAGILGSASTRIKSEIRQLAGIKGDGSIAQIFKVLAVNPAKDRQTRKGKQAEQKENAANQTESGKSESGKAESGKAALPDSQNAAILRQAQDGVNPAIDTAGDIVTKLAAEKNLLNDWANAAIRQSAIVERIRQSGNEGIKLRAIIAEFPGVSERTLRYDFQKLCSQGILERIGPGGPASSYRVRVI